jgi:HAD superfamily hydrolase (TIGR01509 family)
MLFFAATVRESSMPDCDLVIFDCDGVLIDSEVLSCRCLAEVLADHGVAMSEAEVAERFLGRGYAAVPAYVRAHTGRSLPETFARDLHERQSARFVAALLPMPHIAGVLAALDRPYCLASSSDSERIRISLSVTGLDRFFGERIFTAAMVPHAKPAPDLFLLAAARMRAAPGRTLVVEDSINGVLAAKAAGMTVWGFTGGSHYAGRDVAPQLTAAGADRVFHTMADFDAA